MDFFDTSGSTYTLQTPMGQPSLGLSPFENWHDLEPLAFSQPYGSSYGDTWGQFQPQLKRRDTGPSLLESLSAVTAPILGYLSATLGGEEPVSSAPQEDSSSSTTSSATATDSDVTPSSPEAAGNDRITCIKGSSSTSSAQARELLAEKTGRTAGKVIKFKTESSGTFFCDLGSFSIKGDNGATPAVVPPSQKLETSEPLPLLTATPSQQEPIATEPEAGGHAIPEATTLTESVVQSAKELGRTAVETIQNNPDKAALVLLVGLFALTVWIKKRKERTVIDLNGLPLPAPGQVQHYTLPDGRILTLEGSRMQPAPQPMPIMAPAASSQKNNDVPFERVSLPI